MIASQIVAGLYLGGLDAAEEAKRKYDMKIISVMWEGEANCNLFSEIFVPTTQHIEGTHPIAIPANMDLIADIIEDFIFVHKRHVLVHCAYGVERSPLTVAWYLMKRWNMSLIEAYIKIFSMRPQASFRGQWIPESIRNQFARGEYVGGD